MSAYSSIYDLSAKQQMGLDTLIRSHNYAHIRELLEAAKATLDLDLARSTLHRYVLRLKERDRLLIGSRPEGSTVIVVDHETGQITRLHVSCTGDDVNDALAGLPTDSDTRTK